MALAMGKFVKMHGLGNDFVIIDARDAPVDMPRTRARAIADRHMGIGCDQLIVIEPSTRADIKMRIWNCDGGEVEACGNATRCVAALFQQPSISIESGDDILRAENGGDIITLTYPAPRFDADAIPIAYAMDTLAMPVAWGPLQAPAAINVGNPHIVFFVEDLAAIPLASLGPEIENDTLFPERINVNVAEITGPSSIDLLVWERGAGLTRACGTGALASALAAIATRRATSPVAVTLPGGTLHIAWDGRGTATISGPATLVYRGEADWARFG